MLWGDTFCGFVWRHVDDKMFTFTTTQGKPCQYLRCIAKFFLGIVSLCFRVHWLDKEESHFRNCQPNGYTCKFYKTESKGIHV